MAAASANGRRHIVEIGQVLVLVRVFVLLAVAFPLVLVLALALVFVLLLFLFLFLLFLVGSFFRRRLLLFGDRRDEAFDSGEELLLERAGNVACVDRLDDLVAKLERPRVSTRDIAGGDERRDRVRLRRERLSECCG